jgi:pimeloyl-ACP methyl ester carboxylesterase
MKKISLAYIIACFCLSATAQGIAGSWQGKLNAGGTEVRLVFNFSKTGELYSATFDSPDQKVFGLAVDKITVIKDSIIAEMAILPGGYTGKWDGADKITGIFTQRRSSTPLDLVRLSEVQKVLPPVLKPKPQTPKPPYPYLSENVVYDNMDHTMHFGATLTKPTGSGKFPAVVIITGSGSQDRDGTIGSHKIYAVLADYLTRNGIAVLRVDDRGMGGSSAGDLDKATSAEFAKDVETGINYLLARTDIDSRKIGLIGHSEGGMIAPMVAARRKDLAFIVLLAGPGIPCEEIWDYQMGRSFIMPGLNEKDHQKAASLVHNAFGAMKRSVDYDTITANMHAAYSNWKKDVPDSMETRLLMVKGDKGFINWATQTKQARAFYWMNYFLNYNPAVNLQKVKCPVLALNGENDIQILCKENLAGITAALEKGNNKQSEIKALPGLNHLFQSCKSPLDNYELLEETFSPTAMQVISDWIHARTK